MIALLTLIGPALVLGFLLGTAVGRLAGRPRTRATVAGTLALALAATIVGGVAASGLVPGRSGLWVEVAALLLVAYLAGAGLGAVLVPRRTSA